MLCFLMHVQYYVQCMLNLNIVAVTVIFSNQLNSSVAVLIDSTDIVSFFQYSNNFNVLIKFTKLLTIKNNFFELQTLTEEKSK